MADADETSNKSITGNSVTGRLSDPMVAAVIALGFTQIIGWGTSLYAPGILGKPITDDTGWSATLVYGGLSLGLIVSSIVSRRIGRLIDQRGGRLIMSTGSLLLAVGLAFVAIAKTPVMYLIGWVVLGLAMRMTLYDAAFAAIVQVTPTRGRRAISFITLFGGVASTIFWPIGYMLDANYGWRATLLIFAAINILVCLPLHWFGLARRDPVAAPGSSAPKTVDTAPAFAPLDAVDRRPAMLLFSVVMAASAFCYGALAAHLVPVLASTGLAAAAAVWLASFKGVVQTLSRLIDLVFGTTLHPVTLGRITLAFLPLSFVVLLVGGASITTGLIFVIVFGIANGLTTIVRGAVPLALFGPKGYGETLGILATPYLVMNALAPTLFAFISEQFGMTTGLATLLVMGLIAFGGIEGLARWLARRPNGQGQQ